MILSPLVFDFPDLSERVGLPGLPLFKVGLPERPLGGRVSPADGGGPPLGAGGAGGSSAQELDAMMLRRRTK